MILNSLDHNSEVNHALKSIGLTWSMVIRNSDSIPNRQIHVQGVPAGLGLSNRAWADLDFCSSAWAYGKLAELAEQVNKLMEHHKSKSTQPGSESCWDTLYCVVQINDKRGMYKDAWDKF